MNLRRAAVGWAAGISLAALSAGLGIAAWARLEGDKPAPKAGKSSDSKSVVTILIANPKAGSAEPVGDVTTLYTGTKEPLSPPYSQV